MLTERRKADRLKMADIIEEIAAVNHCKTERETIGREIMVRLEGPRGLCCTFSFDGDSPQPDVFVNPWHMALNTDACLSDAFPGSVNQCHWSKSTTVCEGFTALCSHIRRVLIMASDGTAFSAEHEAASIRKNGTWQERAARFDRWSADVLKDSTL